MNDHRTDRLTASANEIASVLARYRASGLGLKDFALQAGLSPGRLHYWVYQKPGARTGRRPTQATATAAAPVFQEIKLPCRPEWGGLWAAEVGLPGGLTVRFSASASAPWIGSVVQTLQRPC